MRRNSSYYFDPEHLKAGTGREGMEHMAGKESRRLNVSFAVSPGLIRSNWP